MTARTFHFNHTSHPIWGIGFRPFFLLGGLAGSGLLGLWLYVLTGHPLAGISPLWHAHEMLFGFGTAILAGFLLTASQNWSGMRGVHGGKLITLAGCWLAGRLAMLSPWPPVTACLDLLFLPVLLAMIWPYLSGVKQKRNRVFLVFFGLQIFGNLLYHSDILGLNLIPGQSLARVGLYLGLDVYLMAIVLVAGRIIPVFTRNAVSEARIQSWPLVEKTSFVLMAAWLPADLGWPDQTLTAWLALAIGLLQTWRWLGWHPWQTRRQPVLWILFAGYAWLILGFVLRGLPAPWAPALPVATHAFTAGAMGVMMYAMMSRVGLGHTGRSIQASQLMITGYLMINLAAGIRVFVPWLLPGYYAQGLQIAGVLWSLAFVFYLWEYLPYLSQPRPDGKEG